MKRIFSLITVIGAALLLQGCVTSLLVGTGVAAGAKVATDPRTVGQQVDDETLELRVSSAINNDEQIKAEARVVVVSYSGRILLIGQTPNESLKDIATNLARGVEGVQDTYNEMRIVPKINFGQIAKDSLITTQVKSKMFVSSSIKATDVKVISENNEVFLLGNLTAQQADAAADIASKTAGVSGVVKVVKYLE